VCIFKPPHPCLKFIAEYFNGTDIFRVFSYRIINTATISSTQYFISFLLNAEYVFIKFRIILRGTVYKTYFKTY
jgi:hypothetical protein